MLKGRKRGLWLVVRVNKGYECHQKEGSMSSTWVLMDYGDVIVHVFSKEDRLFYDLERIWRDGKIVESVDEL